MFNLFARQLGKKVVHHAAARHTRPGGFLDIRYGWSLLRDPHVPGTSKFAALALGMVLTGVLVSVEAPLEAILGVFLPILGVAADVMIDGLEIVALPLVFACLLLPRLTATR